MNALYQCAVEQLEKWAQNPLSMFTDGCTVFSTAPEREEILESLTTQPYHDVVEPLKAVITAILEVIQWQLQTQLPGGEFWEACPQLQEQAALCVNNNISGERNIARLDAHLHRAPNISVGKIESKVMFRSKSTREWWQNRPDSERKRCINSAISDGVVERKRDVHKKKKRNEKVKLYKTKEEATGTHRKGRKSPENSGRTDGKHHNTEMPQVLSQISWTLQWPH